MRFLQIALLTVPISLFAVPVFANPQSCGSSYWMLPNGKCLNLNYTTILGASRANAANANAAYQRLFDANVRLSVLEALVDKESSEAEKERRLNNLVDAKRSTDKVNQMHQSVEDTLYPTHRRAMGEVEKAYSR